jgi:endoglucanase
MSLRSSFYVPLVVIMLGLAGCATSSAMPDGQPAIHLNQVGFYPHGPKLAAVLGAATDEFTIVGEGGEVAFRGALGPERRWEFSDEVVRLADFSAMQEIGRFRLVLADGGTSDEFVVEPGVLGDVARAALKAFYFQRVSTELKEEFAGEWARPAGHPDTNVIVHPSAASPERPAGTIIRAPYGWYDAGDYNKYVVNSGISTYQILAMYEHHPEAARDFRVGIPESGGPMPDILAEALWNLRWMLAMQDPYDGGVYHKLTTARFEDAVMPHEAPSQRYVVQKSVTAALNFAAVMAQGSRVYSAYEAELADSMGTAAIAAWEWARRNPDAHYDQTAMNERFDPDVVTGAYGDDDPSDEFAWAAVELFLTTGVDSFFAAIDHVGSWSVPHWGDVRALGYYSLLRAEDRAGESARIEDVRRELIAMADALVDSRSRSAYGIVMGVDREDFVWGSNAVAANQGIALVRAYELTGDRRYLEAAISNLDYILGRNPLGLSYVTGIGHRYPMHIHHRPSEADGNPEPVPGLLAGGPNPGQQDRAGCDDYGQAGRYPSSLPAHSFLDHWCSYASNEIAINWNAPLAYLAFAVETVMSK